MPRPSRNLVLVAMLMALGLSATAVGHPHPIHEPATTQNAQEQLTAYPVGLYRYYEEALAAQAQITACDELAMHELKPDAMAKAKE